MVEKRKAEAGYNLVILMVAMTLLNIALAIALPKWSHVIRREKEEELISRGFQYAEAIRRFNGDQHRPPVRLEELVELRPRAMRRLWKDPMTEDGNWALISANIAEGNQPPDGLPPAGEEPKEDPDGRPPKPDDAEELDPGTGIGEDKGLQQMGPFSGVRSRSTKESILIFNGRTRYDEWHFRMDMIQGLMTGQGTGGGFMPPPPTGNVLGRAGLIPDLSTRWLGRPLPASLMPPQPQDGQLPGGDSQKPPPK